MHMKKCLDVGTCVCWLVGPPKMEAGVFVFACGRVYVCVCVWTGRQCQFIFLICVIHAQTYTHTHTYRTMAAT